MSERWKTLAARIDALGLRERVFLFLAVLVITVAVVDTWWVSPERIRHQQVRQLFDANAAELRRLRDESRLKALRPDATRQARDELAQVQSRIAAVDSAMASAAGSTAVVTALPDVMRLFLRRYPALTLVRTGNLTADAPNPTRPVLVPRQGLELTVAGPYAELVRFVQTLEAALPDLRWGQFKLQAEQQPPELTLQVFLVGVRP